MRARSIKPGICDNELLGTADPLCTLLFERLWMMADREGRLEDRPLRIKAQAFPYRDGLDVEPILAWLHAHGFIERYVADGQRLIAVTKFTEHQNPHVREPASKLPGPDKAVPSTVPEPGEASPDPCSARLTPDSGLLTPDSGLRTRDNARASTGPVDDESDPQAFARIRALYPKRAGRTDWLNGERNARRLIERGVRWRELEAAVQRYAQHLEATGKTGTQYVLGPENFFGARDDPWRQQWPLPAKPETAYDRIQRLNGGAPSAPDPTVIEHDDDRAEPSRRALA